jgi:hypothetical protein
MDHLPLDDFDGALELGLVFRPDAQEVGGVADGRQGIPQLVGQHRQEFVLAPVGVAQGLLHELPLDDGNRRRDQVRDPSRIVP